MKRHLECAEQAKSTSNLTKYCACHAKCISWLIRVTYETSFRMRGASNVNLQPQQTLRLPRKMNLMFDPRLIWNFISNAQSKQCQPPTSANTAPATKSLSSRLQRKLSELLPPIERRFDDIPTTFRAWNRHLAPAASETLLVPSWRRILYGKIQHFALRLSPKMSPNAAPATKSDNPTSPNTAPATQNESHDWCTSHMKRHFQCAEQAMSTSNLSKYCACHEIFKFKISAENPWIASANIKTIPYSSHLGDAFCMEKYNIWRSGYLSKFHEILPLPRKVTLQLQQILRLPRKMNLLASIRSWHLFTLGIYSLLASILSWHLFSTPTSPNTAPATQNASHDWSASHMKRHLECAEQQTSHDKFTKYCACHAKWISWLIRVTYETSFTRRGASTVSLQPHQILRLPRNL